MHVNLICLEKIKCPRLIFHALFVKRIAAISKLTATFYDMPFARHLNYTDHEKYIVDEIRSFSKVDWFKENNGNFGKYFRAPFAETLTKRGVAFSFNLMDFEELLNSQT